MGRRASFVSRLSRFSRTLPSHPASRASSAPPQTPPSTSIVSPASPQSPVFSASTSTSCSPSSSLLPPSSSSPSTSWPLPVPDADLDDDVRSLQQLALLCPRARVLVHPIEWTALHLGLLDASFVRARRLTASDQPQARPPRFTSSEKSIASARLLATSVTHGQRHRAVRSLLAKADSPLTESRHGFRFRYGNRPVNTPMGSMGFCLRSISDKKCRIPIAAWTSCSQLRSLRFQAMRLNKLTPRANLPVWQMARLRFLGMQPRNPLRDPFTLGTLISIAQAQRSALSISGLPVPPLILVHVVCTDENDLSYIHVFSANIPAQLLDMFDSPTTAAPLLPAIPIRTMTIPFDPPQTLQSRLLELIVPEWYEHQPQKGKKEKGKDKKTRTRK